MQERDVVVRQEVRGSERGEEDEAIILQLQTGDAAQALTLPSATHSLAPPNTTGA